MQFFYPWLQFLHTLLISIWCPTVEAGMCTLDLPRKAPELLAGWAWAASSIALKPCLHCIKAVWKQCPTFAHASCMCLPGACPHGNVSNSPTRTHGEPPCRCFSVASTQDNVHVGASMEAAHPFSIQMILWGIAQCWPLIKRWTTIRALAYKPS